MPSLPLIPSYYDEQVADREFPFFLRKFCAEIGLRYESKECQQVTVFTQPQPKGSIYTRGLYQWRRDEVKDMEDAAQKMAGDSYVVTVQKAGPDTRTPIQKIWAEWNGLIGVACFLILLFITICLSCCCSLCKSKRQLAKAAKRTRKQREREEERKRREPTLGYLRKKSRTSTIGDIELGNVDQVLLILHTLFVCSDVRRTLRSQYRCKRTSPPCPRPISILRIAELVLEPHHITERNRVRITNSLSSASPYSLIIIIWGKVVSFPGRGFCGRNMSSIELHT